MDKPKFECAIENGTALGDADCDGNHSEPAGICKVRAFQDQGQITIVTMKPALTKDPIKELVMAGLTSEVMDLRLLHAQDTTVATLTTSSPMENETSCGEHILNYGHVEKMVIGVILTLLTFLTICGNLLVVMSVCFVKKLKQPSNYLIVSLAIADLSVALAVMPFVSITDLIGGQWIFGRVFCNVFIAMDVMCCTASIMTLCVISIDR